MPHDGEGHDIQPHCGHRETFPLMVQRCCYGNAFPRSGNAEIDRNQLLAKLTVDKNFHAKRIVTHTPEYECKSRINRTYYP
jgi:hypothetical protein